MGAAPSRISALIDFRSPDEGVPARRLAFGAPLVRLVATRLDEVPALLDAVEAHAHAGRWCTGFLRYEAAAAFDRALATHEADGALARFDVHEAPLANDDADAAQAWQGDGEAAVRWSADLPRETFDASIAEIHRAIADGELYQVNLTATRHGRVSGDALALFAALRRAQPGAYAAYLDFASDDDADPEVVPADPGETILSVSPELFLDWRDGRLLARPMKGTAPRGATPAADAAQARHLAESPKERAENLMIVDLLRNDLSRVAQPFSVKVPRLFHTQAWPTVWQMSSDVTALTRQGTRLREVFGALFPCGSVTGAPKVQAMRAIRRLEPGPRGVYCGAVGIVAPGGAATFNVPIRTVVLRADGEASCGIGSGITADATADDEWAEWRTKRAFVDRASHAFELLETLRLQEGRFRLLERHVARLAAAAEHFGFAWRPDDAATGVHAALHALAHAHTTGRWRVRLCASADGTVRAEAHPFTGPCEGDPAPEKTPRVHLAATPLAEAGGEFVRYKTTHRAHYDAYSPSDPDVFDTLLFNEDHELTEFTRGTVALKLDGRWWTPPLECGLLPGVGRAAAIESGVLAERVMGVGDLARAEEIAFLNSLRGWIPVTLVGDD